MTSEKLTLNTLIEFVEGDTIRTLPLHQCSARQLLGAVQRLATEAGRTATDAAALMKSLQEALGPERGQ